jgi:hypothetical protein
MILCLQRPGTGDVTQHDWFRSQALEAALRRCGGWLETAGTARQRDLEAPELLGDLRELAVTLDERRRAHGMALAMLSREDSQDGILNYAGALAEFAATPDERACTRRELIRALAAGTESWAVQVITDTLFLLGITSPEKAELKAILITMYAQGPHIDRAESAARQIIRLNPVLEDLHGSVEWPCKPTSDLLAAVRRNTTLPAWLAALPEITTN